MEKITPKEYFKGYRFEILDFIEKKGLANEKLYPYECQQLYSWYLRNLEFECLNYAQKIIIPKLKNERRSNRTAKYLTVRGNKGYSFIEDIIDD